MRLPRRPLFMKVDLANQKLEEFNFGWFSYNIRFVIRSDSSLEEIAAEVCVRNWSM